MSQLRDSEKLPFDTGSCFFIFIKIVIFEYCGRFIKNNRFYRHWRKQKLKRIIQQVKENMMLTGSCHEEGAAS